MRLVYDLREPGGSSDRFYADLSAFSDLVLAEIDLRARDTLSDYANFVRDRLGETPRSMADYSIELLTLGQALCLYAGAVESTPKWAVTVARKLFKMRRKSPWIKPAADLSRAALTRYFLMPNIGCKVTDARESLDRLPSLIEWLQATGEFEQEADRLSNWNDFLGQLPRAEGSLCVVAAADLFHWFAREADHALGSYTRGVPEFLTGPYARRGCREDQIFCARRPVEYHLNMVAAEVMNQGLLEDFERKPHRAVLVPTCMRGSKAAGCCARASEMGLVCTACDPGCAVNRITGRMRSLGAKVYLIPHSTGFSRWLERWQHMPDVGIVAVACMLNILPGGFEMRARGIAAQCVPLDFPGCRKHWSPRGIATGVNEERLVQIVRASRP